MSKILWVSHSIPIHVTGPVMSHLSGTHYHAMLSTFKSWLQKYDFSSHLIDFTVERVIVY